MRDQLDKARDAVDFFKQTLGAENFFLELQNHGIPEQAKVNKLLIPWAKEFGLKLVGTNDVHYINKSDSHAHDCLVCIGTQDLLSNPKRMSAGYIPEQFFLRSAEEMKARFAEAPEAVTNTLEVAEKCNLEIEFGKLHYPVFHPPEHFTREGYLRKLLAEGLHKRYGIHAKAEGEKFVVEKIDDPKLLPTFSENENQDAALKVVLDRLQLELKVIEKTGFLSYFLIVGDFIRYGHERGIACVARGSAAGSIVTYLLEISNVDPIRYGLLFERFLNPERVNPPDIDIDFADDRRADVIKYVSEKYGRDSVAQIITFGTMGAKSVVRDVARVMGLPYGDGDRLAKMIPFDLKMTLEKALKQSPDLKAAYENEDVTRELIDTALILEDITRNASVHAAGVVIGDQPLVNLLPLKLDDSGSLVTQYAMNPVGDLGLLKMDFLGLKTLTVIRNTCEMVKRTQGIQIDIDHLPLDDAKTYDLLNKAETLGIFQLESGGMRDLCRKFQISSVEHITALIALYRPGPMELIPEFIKRRHGEIEIKYEHPLLEQISKETYGILIYQEQVMQAAQILAGFTLGAADLLRRAMGKKKVEEMQQQREKFVKGCAVTNKIPAAKANQIFDLLEKFAGYGFNKSHAAAYAIVAYQTAYLKANFPVEFFCAMMTNDMANTEKLSEYIAEAREFGIEVLQPDVNESEMFFAPGAAVVARASSPCVENERLTGGTPVPLKSAPLPFIPFDKNRPASVYTRSLPHWQQEGATYFVTFRLADSLPREVLNRWREELDAALRAAAEKISEEHYEKLQRHLDEGMGECWLRNPEVAAIVENALRHFDGERYQLGSYVIMPNHVHVLVRPTMAHKLTDILHSWKSFTAKEANKVLGRTGEFWQDESFDHIVRDEQQLEKFSRYIIENPAKAGIVARASSPCDQNKRLTGGTPVPLAPIRFGLVAIKGVGEAAVEAILKARNENGNFKSLSELCERVDGRSLTRKTLEALIKTGACDAFGQTRATLFAQIERTLSRAASILSDKQKGQSSLFGALEEKAPPMPEAISNLPEWPQHELLAHEKELLGFYVTGHPLTPFAPILEKYTLTNLAMLAELPNRSLTRVGGMISAVTHGFSKKSGKPYSLVTLEDLDGSVQLLVMNDHEKFRPLLEANKAILVIGEVSTGEDKPKIFPQEIMPLEDAPKKFTKQVHLRLHTAHLKPDDIESVRGIVAANPGKCPLLLCFMQPGGGTVFMDTNERFAVTPSLKLQHEADARFGEETYYAKVDMTLPERQSRWPRKTENGNGEE
jgi:DNA polymerase III alpha subunit